MSLLETTTALGQLMIDARKSSRELAPKLERRLRRLLTNAKSIPHYREQMEQAGYDPVREFNGESDLSILQVTSKSDLKSAPERFVHAGSGPLRQYFSDHTSGSTGTPLTVYRSRPERAVQIAKWMRVLMLSGYRPTDKVLSFTGPGRLSEGRTMLQRFGLLRRRAIDYTSPGDTLTDALLDYRPNVVYGNRTSLLLVAEELERRGVSIEPLKLLFGGGEVIDAQTRRQCRKTFGVDITQTYGSIEMGVMAHQRPGQDSLSLIEDCTLFEFLDEQGNPAKPGELARVVVTDLHGRLMPFIRYEQGDLAIYGFGQNAHGETVRVIERLVGRQEETLALRDGRCLTWLNFYEIMADYHGVQRFRVRQRDLDTFIVELVTTFDYYGTIKARLLRQLQALSKLPLRFDVRVVERIDPDPSGKIRMLVSEATE